MARVSAVKNVVSDSAATYYTVPSGKTFTIASAWAINTTATATADLTVYLVDSGGANTDGNATVINDLAVANTEVQGVGFEKLIGVTMSAGDFIQAVADTASVITLHISGDEV